MPKKPKNPSWYCCRQVAGPLVKESRALRPRLSKDDGPWEQREKRKILHPSVTPVCRTRTDRLELRLALFGYEGQMYTCTFAPEYNPQSLKETRKYWRSFLRRLKLLKNNKPFDYIYCIEGRHGDHRFHIHLVIRESDFTPQQIAEAWRFGQIDVKPVLLDKGGYRRLAEYFNKEANDGVRVPVGARTWVASKSLNQKLPKPEYFRSTSGRIYIPANVHGTVWKPMPVQNDFGIYCYASYIIKPNARHKFKQGI